MGLPSRTRAATRQNNKTEQEQDRRSFAGEVEHDKTIATLAEEAFLQQGYVSFWRVIK